MIELPPPSVIELHSIAQVAAAFQNAEKVSGRGYEAMLDQDGRESADRECAVADWKALDVGVSEQAVQEWRQTVRFFWQPGASEYGKVALATLSGWLGIEDALRTPRVVRVSGEVRKLFPPSMGPVEVPPFGYRFEFVD